jgi:hypothetical protein
MIRAAWTTVPVSVMSGVSLNTDLFGILGKENVCDIRKVTDSLLGYGAMQSRRSRPTFRRCVLPPLSFYEATRRHILEQGWANFFVGGPNEKSKMSGGPTYILLAILVNNNKPETQTRAARIAKQVKVRQKVLASGMRCARIHVIFVPTFAFHYSAFIF